MNWVYLFWVVNHPKWKYYTISNYTEWISPPIKTFREPSAANFCLWILQWTFTCYLFINNYLINWYCCFMAIIWWWCFVKFYNFAWNHSKWRKMFFFELCSTIFLAIIFFELPKNDISLLIRKCFFLPDRIIHEKNMKYHFLRINFLRSEL